uniref:Uncharacterized protein n=1 Tax=Strigamia maritima TaxID=126957 RepID=T1J781_STRMM
MKKNDILKALRTGMTLLNFYANTLMHYSTQRLQTKTDPTENSSDQHHNQKQLCGHCHEFEPRKKQSTCYIVRWHNSPSIGWSRDCVPHLVRSPAAQPLCSARAPHRDNWLANSATHA